MNLYLDIETIPAQSPQAHAAIAKTVRPPAQMKKADTIAAWEANDKPQAVAEAIAKTSLDGAYGHIFCIGWAFEDEAPRTINIDPGAPYGEDEMLEDFTETMNARLGNFFEPIRVIGHNVAAFDIRFIWQRAIILGVRMPHWFPRDPKPWSDEVFDTMTAFAGARNMIGMDRLCSVLGFPGKGDIDGSKIAGLYAAGRYAEITEYCRDDIERTRAIHRRMLVAFGEAA